MSKNLFFIGLIVAATGLISPPVALAGGIVFGFTFAHPFNMEARRLSKFLLQASVVGLGFGMNLHEVIRVGRSGFVYTAASISFALLLGWALGRFLKGQADEPRSSFRPAQPFAAAAPLLPWRPITEAGDEEIAVSLGTVFVSQFNRAAHISRRSVCCCICRKLSSACGRRWPFMTQARWWVQPPNIGALALLVGTTVKLARALWIVPISVATAMARKSNARMQWPWFILLFCLAAVANTYVRAFQPAYPILKHLGVIGLTATLFLIGTGLSTKTLRQVGVRPLLQGVLLWIVVAVGSLSLIRSGWIHL